MSLGIECMTLSYRNTFHEQIQFLCCLASDYKPVALVLVKTQPSPLSEKDISSGLCLCLTHTHSIIWVFYQSVCQCNRCWPRGAEERNGRMKVRLRLRPGEEYGWWNLNERNGPRWRTHTQPKPRICSSK